MACLWAVLEEGGDGLDGGGGWGAWLLEVWGEKGVNSGECGVLVD